MVRKSDKHHIVKFAESWLIWRFLWEFGGSYRNSVRQSLRIGATFAQAKSVNNAHVINITKPDVFVRSERHYDYAKKLLC